MCVLSLAFSLAQPLWFWMSPLCFIIARCPFFLDISAVFILHWQARPCTNCMGLRWGVQNFSIADNRHFVTVVLLIKHLLFIQLAVVITIFWASLL